VPNKSRRSAPHNLKSNTDAFVINDIQPSRAPKKVNILAGAAQNKVINSSSQRSLAIQSHA
jgi:hypothetical protein